MCLSTFFCWQDAAVSVQKSRTFNALINFGRTKTVYNPNINDLAKANEKTFIEERNEQSRAIIARTVRQSNVQLGRRS